MSEQPVLLDLYCKAGGCTKGYQRAGFRVIGVDIEPQPHYCGDGFLQADALEVLDALARDRALFCGPGLTIVTVDGVHASPPCQAFTSLSSMWNAKEHADLLTPTRELLIETGLPYVIENVPGAPMTNALVLCGSSFGLEAEGAQLRRHRHFETNFPVMAPPCAHGRSDRVIGVYGGHGRDRRRGFNTQNYSVESRRVAMGIDWMNGTELSQAIPPAYTEHIGYYLMQEVRRPAVR